MSSNTHPESEALLTRRVEKVLPSKKRLAKLLTERRIRLYQGFDPTGARLHLGHTIGIKKLMEFALLGHEVIFLFGTGTVLVGDPSQRSVTRKLIKQEEIEANIRNWKKQVEPIVDFERVKIMQNGDWLSGLTLKDIVGIAANISAVQLFKREMFQRRLEKGDTVWYHETLYPLLQGYDSVVMDVDLEIGGTDQEFNMLIGRELLRKMKGKEKFVLEVPMIMGTDGKPMSKTSQNCIWIDDTPEHMFGKLMRIPDEQISPYRELLTDLPLNKAKRLTKDPLASKKRLALEVTSQFHGQAKARKSQANFERTVQKGKAPTKVERFSIVPGTHTIMAICKAARLSVSASQIKRTIGQGGVEWDGTKITDPNRNIAVKGGEILKFGKRVFRMASTKNQ